MKRKPVLKNGFLAIVTILGNGTLKTSVRSYGTFSMENILKANTLGRSQLVTGLKWMFGTILKGKTSVFLPYILPMSVRWSFVVIPGSRFLNT